jgi:hypothetical protein
VTELSPPGTTEQVAPADYGERHTKETDEDFLVSDKRRLHNDVHQVWESNEQGSEAKEDVANHR